MLPTTNGARIVYEKGIRPFLCEHESINLDKWKKKVDPFKEAINSSINSHDE
jgi:hypothetical protein